MTALTPVGLLPSEQRPLPATPCTSPWALPPLPTHPGCVQVDCESSSRIKSKHLEGGFQQAPLVAVPCSLHSLRVPSSQPNPTLQGSYCLEAPEIAVLSTAWALLKASLNSGHQLLWCFDVYHLLFSHRSHRWTKGSGPSGRVTFGAGGPWKSNARLAHSALLSWQAWPSWGSGKASVSCGEKDQQSA